MLAGHQFDPERRAVGLEIELNLTDERRRSGDGQRRRRSRRSPTPTSRPRSASSTWRSTSRRTCSGPTCSPARTRGAAPASTTPRSARGKIGAHMMLIGILPTLTEGHVNATRSAPASGTRCSTSRSSPLAGRTCRSRSTGSNGCAPTPTRSRPKRPARACSCISRSSRRRSPTTGTPRRQSPACSSRWAPTRPSSSASELWRETRIALFEQATDTRPEELKAQGVRPRVWFGERWITSIFDLFEENVRYFPALLPVCDDEDPVEVLERGDVPRLAGAAPAQRHDLPLEPADLRRVRRPAAPAGGEPGAACRSHRGRHPGQRRAVLRPDPVSLIEDERPLWSQMSFSAAAENFHAGARSGIEAPVYWPGVGEAPAAELVLRRLLPMAHEGLDRWGVAAADRDRLLGIIERRCIIVAERCLMAERDVPPPPRGHGTSTGSRRCAR